MRIRRLRTRPFAVLAVLSITLLAPGAASAGFLDTLCPATGRPQRAVARAVQSIGPAVQPIGPAVRPIGPAVQPIGPAVLPYAATASLAQPYGITQPPIDPNLGYGTSYGTAFCV